MEINRCYEIRDLQAILHISRPTVYKLLQQNTFKWVKVGGKYLISKKSFDEWLDGSEESEVSTSAEEEINGVDQETWK